jgi:hypothetical protein
MKALLVWPLFPKSYWGQEYTLALIGKSAVVPPLGLITAAALLPSHWELLEAARRRGAAAMSQAMHAEHMIRYTFEDVLPRLREPRPWLRFEG